jgi:hypothetical protein
MPRRPRWSSPHRWRRALAAGEGARRLAGERCDLGDSDDAADGVAIDTASEGPKSFDASATDQAGNQSLVSHGYPTEATT